MFFSGRSLRSAGFLDLETSSTCVLTLVFLMSLRRSHNETNLTRSHVSSTDSDDFKTYNTATMDCGLMSKYSELLVNLFVLTRRINATVSDAIHYRQKAPATSPCRSQVWWTTTPTASNDKQPSNDGTLAISCKFAVLPYLLILNTQQMYNWSDCKTTNKLYNLSALSAFSCFLESL